MKDKKRRGPVCTLCLQSGVHLDACVNPNNRREDGRCCADGCPAMLLAQECPRKQGGVCRQLVEETAEVVEAGVSLSNKMLIRWHLLQGHMFWGGEIE